MNTHPDKTDRASDLIFYIGPIRWAVELVDDIPQMDGSHVWGVCMFITHQIKISRQAPSDMRLVTLMHELYHAWRGMFGPKESGEEGEADWFAHVSAEIMIQMREQHEAIATYLGCSLDGLTRSRR